MRFPQVTNGSSVGEAFTFLSGLYFRGKVVYSRAFARPPAGCAGALVITPDRGLLPVDTVVSIQDLRAFASVPVDMSEPRYVEPLCATVQDLANRAGPRCEVVLLGSIATGKYVNCLIPVFGERLRFPREFVGRGDMSRGGLMLRCASSGEELEYISVAGAVRRGPRPPKLKPLPRKS